MQKEGKKVCVDLNLRKIQSGQDNKRLESVSTFEKELLDCFPYLHKNHSDHLCTRMEFLF